MNKNKKVLIGSSLALALTLGVFTVPTLLTGKTGTSTSYSSGSSKGSSINTGINKGIISKGVGSGSSTSTNIAHSKGTTSYSSGSSKGVSSKTVQPKSWWQIWK